MVRVFDIALSELLDDAAFRQELWDIDGAVLDTAPGPTVRSTSTRFPGETVWGATARILTGFLTQLTRDR